MLKAVKGVVDAHASKIAIERGQPGRYRVVASCKVRRELETTSDLVTTLAEGDEIEIEEVGVFKKQARGRYLQGWLSFASKEGKDGKGGKPYLEPVNPQHTTYSRIYELHPGLRRAPKL